MLRLFLRAVLALSGLAVIAVGLNVGLGGIVTLGWQVAPDFVSINDSANFAIQDSHVRFHGGMFTVLGVALVAGAVLLPRFWSGLAILCALMPLGGLFRLSGGAGSVFRPELATSLAFEFILFPFLAIAIWRTYGRQEGAKPQ
jgi:hypothetical protein